MVSVLLPARNASATLEVAVRSILEQSLDNFELIAVDDRSDDDTGQRLLKLANGDPRIRVISGEGRGLSRALNLGLAHCRAPYVARMDADDQSLPTRLEKSVAALEADPGLAAVGTQVEIFRDDRPVSPNMSAYGRWLGSLTTPQTLFAERYVESPLCHPASTLRRSALQAVGGWSDDEMPEDYRLWLELLAQGHRLVNLPQVLFRWRDHDQRLTRCDPRYGLDRHLKLKAHFLARERASALLWGAGRSGLSLMRLLRDEGMEITGLVDVDPGKIGQRIDGVKVLSHLELGPPGDRHLISAVGAKGARAKIRAFLAEAGWVEGQHYTCAA